MEPSGKRGRPKGSVAEKTREETIVVKAFPREKEAYQAAADREGLNLSSWIRFHLNRVARGDSKE